MEAPDGADECSYLRSAIAASRLENFESSSVEFAEFENDLVISDWFTVAFDVPSSFCDVDGSIGVEVGSG